MLNYYKSLAVLAVAAGLPVSAGAVTVTVDGTGGTATTYAKLSEAVDYVNNNSSEPNVINVTANHTDDTQIQVLVPMTINGDVGGAAAEIAVDRDVIRTAADVGLVDRNYIEVQTAGNVTINDLLVFPLGTNSTAIENGVALGKPDSGVGEYVFNDFILTGGSDTGPFAPTVADPYYEGDGTRFWYGYAAGRGAFNIEDEGGAGSYNATLNNCGIAGARTNLVYITNQSGTTTINGGVFNGAGEDVMEVNGATGVSIVGTPQNRVRFSSGNATLLGGYQLRVTGDAVIDEIAYTDFVNQARGDAAADPVQGTAILVESGEITEMDHVRAGNVSGHAMHVQDGVVNVSNSTFHANGVVSFGERQPTEIPVWIDLGTVTFTDSIFTSALTDGYVAIYGGDVDFTNSALPTDGDEGESLWTGGAIVGDTGAYDETATISVSPGYVTVDYDLTDTVNADFLRPTETAYEGASSEGTYLYGGAGPVPSNVADWQMY